MRSVDYRNSTAIAVAVGLASAAGWFFSSMALLSGSAAEIAPICGAAIIASVVPIQFSKRAAKRKLTRSHLSMSQRLKALDHHVCINMVNENDEITGLNDNFLKLTGYDRKELVGQKIKFLFDKAEPEMADHIRTYLERGETWEGETALRRKDGSILYTQATVSPLFDVNGDWAGSISVRTDVTHTNELISEQDTAQTLHELRDDIWIIDSETEKFSYMNRAARGRLNISGDEYRDKSLSDFSCDNDLTEVMDACRKLRNDGKSSTQFETFYLGVMADVSIKFLPGAEGTGRYLILFSDISHRLEQEQLRNAFISTVSHELRSPLTSIKGAMGLLLSKSAGELPEKVTSLLEIAHRNADRLVLILNDILDLDKISSGQMDFDIKDVDVADLVIEAGRANSMLQQRFSVQLELVGTDTPVPFRTDPNRFIQVLTNLLTNSYKFSDTNSGIIIELSNEVDHIRISVKDEGQGIPASEQHKIFQRFADMSNSDRASKGGTGLGLNICKAIVESLGGEIGFDTEEGVGTTFYFDLPKALPDQIDVSASRVKHVA